MRAMRSNAGEDLRSEQGRSLPGLEMAFRGAKHRDVAFCSPSDAASVSCFRNMGRKPSYVITYTSLVEDAKIKMRVPCKGISLCLIVGLLQMRGMPS